MDQKNQAIIKNRKSAHESQIDSQPISSATTDTGSENDGTQKTQSSNIKPKSILDLMKLPNRFEIVWKHVALIIYLHIAAAFRLFYLVAGHVMWQTVIWIGITAGAHRLWSHKAYKAKLPLKVILVFMQTLSIQKSIWEWSRDHRVHHKYSETNADPHNATRGFLFAHMGWLLCRKHPAVEARLKQIDMSDIEANPLVMFQFRHYKIIVVICGFLTPTSVPWYFWGESFIVSCCFASQFSAAHLWGDKPYDQNINPAGNMFVTMLVFGEGWHNYHHVFPWDYKTAELGPYKYNLTTAFIDFFAWVGWAYDLKTVSEKVIKDRATRTGDGSRRKENSSNDAGNTANVVSDTATGFSHGGPWGWGDKDIPVADVQATQTLCPLVSHHNK